MGVGMTPENTDRSCVFTITINAPQHEHRIGARSNNRLQAMRRKRRPPEPER